MTWRIFSRGAYLSLAAGLGGLSLNVCASSELTSSQPAVSSPASTSDEVAARELAKTIQLQSSLLKQLRNQVDALPANDPTRAEKVRSLAEVEDRIRRESRRKYVSPETQEKPFADYYHALERRIEDRGTREFPTSNGKPMYGKVVLNLIVDRRGYVVGSEVVHSSQNPLLDQKAIEIATAAGPFGHFSSEMLEKADQIVVTSNFRFVHDRRVSPSSGVLN